MTHVSEEPGNKYSKLVRNQKIVVLPTFEFESGVVLEKVPIAYKTWGRLNSEGSNCMVICHALTGSLDVSDWWSHLLGKGKAFDPTKFFIVCLNALGLPYGLASPMTIDPRTGQRYGPHFPLATVRDDARAHKQVLDMLGVRQIAIAIGGSMGGMLALEYPCMFGSPYVRSIAALATCPHHSAWCIAWSEVQRQSIYADPKYQNGFYEVDDGPLTGLAAARMAALLTYRSRDSFEKRFGRQDPLRDQKVSQDKITKQAVEDHWSVHNEGHKHRKQPQDGSLSTEANKSSNNGKKRPQTFFTAQSYLRYQGEKFVDRYDPNCYLSIIRKLDTHDVSRDRFDEDGQPISVEKQLLKITQPSLIMGVTSDVIYPLGELEYMAKHIPNAQLHVVDSPEGHDAFLLSFQEINDVILDFEKRVLDDIMSKEGVVLDAFEDVEETGPGLCAEDLDDW